MKRCTIEREGRGNGYFGDLDRPKSQLESGIKGQKDVDYYLSVAVSSQVIPWCRATLVSAGDADRARIFRGTIIYTVMRDGIVQIIRS